MSDIVERLRNCSSHSGISYCVACKYEKDECCEERLMSEAADEIERLRKDLEAERKKHEWISVKDRLPSKTGMYLAYELETGAWQALYEEEEESFGYWHEIYSLDGLDTRKWEEAQVTHWMPLPDSPKGEEE